MILEDSGRFLARIPTCRWLGLIMLEILKLARFNWIMYVQAMYTCENIYCISYKNTKCLKVEIQMKILFFITVFALYLVLFFRPVRIQYVIPLPSRCNSITMIEGHFFFNKGIRFQMLFLIVVINPTKVYMLQIIPLLEITKLHRHLLIHARPENILSFAVIPLPKFLPP